MFLIKCKKCSGNFGDEGALISGNQWHWVNQYYHLIWNKATSTIPIFCKTVQYIFTFFKKNRRQSIFYGEFILLEWLQGCWEIIDEFSKDLNTFILSAMRSKTSLFLDQLNYLALKKKTVRFFQTPRTFLPNYIAQKCQIVLILNTIVLKPESSRGLFKMSGFFSRKNL
jgi:hypothetical protein